MSGFGLGQELDMKYVELDAALSCVRVRLFNAVPLNSTEIAMSKIDWRRTLRGRIDLDGIRGREWSNGPAPLEIIDRAAETAPHRMTKAANSIKLTTSTGPVKLSKRARKERRDLTKSS